MVNVGTAPETSPHISVAVGVVVGLLASFIQSLGLTIQRKSHLQNEALPFSLRKRDYRRPLWLIGFAIFISSNLLGTIFQIGALPIVVLGPLGAVSLLYNAFFARVILGDEFSVYLVAGTFLIAGGAVLIGIFGVVPEQTHTLKELIALYSRPAFIIWISLLCVTLVAVLVTAHVAEWAFERRLAKVLPPICTTGGTPKLDRRLTTAWRKKRRVSAPARSSSAPGLASAYGAVDEHRGAMQPLLSSSTSRLATTARAEEEQGAKHVAIDIEDDDRLLAARDSLKPLLTIATIERTRLVLGVAYGSASGSLSGLCLLFAKTGVELLILTAVGKNQFGHYQAWMIVLVLVIAAILQLFYLNRALRLAGPTLICPLAFCFYNLSSMISGLIYYDQWDQLSHLQFALVSLGTVVLLAGVWIVSIKADKEDKRQSDKAKASPIIGGHDDFVDEPEATALDSDGESDLEPVEWVPRGLAIGLGAVSPGFEVRPAHHHPRRHARTATLPSSSTFASLASDSDDRPLLVTRTASEADAEAAGRELGRKRRDRRRGFSMSGSLYVGRGGSRGGDGSTSPSPAGTPVSEDPPDTSKRRRVALGS